MEPNNSQIGSIKLHDGKTIKINHMGDKYELIIGNQNIPVKKEYFENLARCSGENQFQKYMSEVLDFNLHFALSNACTNLSSLRIAFSQARVRELESQLVEIVERKLKR